MKHTLWTALGGFALATLACGAKKEETVPPGFCATSIACQPIADRQQGYQNALAERLKAFTTGICLAERTSWQRPRMVIGLSLRTRPHVPRPPVNRTPAPIPARQGS